MKFLFDECMGTTQHAQCPGVLQFRSISTPAVCECECHKGVDFLAKYSHGPGPLGSAAPLGPEQAEEMVKDYNKRYPDGL